MRKRILPVLLVLMPIFCFAYKQEYTAGLKIGYTDNVFNLSEGDLDDLDDGDSRFNFAETADDMSIYTFLKGRLAFRQGKISWKPYGILSQKSYLENTDKSSWNMAVGLDATYRKLDLGVRYGFSPGNYVRDYKDQDATHAYEKYEYDKNYYRLYGNYQFLRHDWLIFEGEIAQYYYNKYFTENDGTKFGFEIGYKHQFKPFSVKLSYGYDKFVPDDDAPSLSEAEQLDFVRDVEAETNYYKAEVRLKRIKLSRRQWVIPYTGFAYSEKFWQTDLPVSIDPIHSGREDKIISFNLGAQVHLTKAIEVSAEYNREQRKVDAEKKDLDETKDYDTNAFEIGVTYSF